MDQPTPPPTVTFVDVEGFRSEAASWMAADPIRTNVMATVSGCPAAAAPGATWILAHSSGEVVGAAFRTPPYPLNLPPMPDVAVEAIARALHARGDVLDLLSGDVRATRTFAQLWAELTGAHGSCITEMGIHVLGELVPPSGVPGAARVATTEDAALVEAWLVAFETEVYPGPPRPQDAAAIQRRLSDGLVMLWEDAGRPVSLAGWHPPQAGVSRVGPVFTPADRRGHGYAAAVTTAATRAALAAGARHVMLFTDLANPTSNGVYARLGYRRVGDASEWRISPPTPA
jgi:predicted GNAT family acetyltransferase